MTKIPFQFTPQISLVYLLEVSIGGIIKYVFFCVCHLWLFSGSDSEESPCNVRDLGSIPGLGRSPGGGHGNPLQYSFLENLHWQRSLVATVHGAAKRHDWVTKHPAHLWLRGTLLCLSVDPLLLSRVSLYGYSTICLSGYSPFGGLLDCFFLSWIELPWRFLTSLCVWYVVIPHG